MERSLRAGRHAESGVLVIRLDFNVTSDIPVEADSSFAGEAGGARCASETRERFATDIHLTVAESHFKGAEVIEASSGLEGIAGAHSGVSVLFAGEQNRGFDLPGFVSDSSRGRFVQYFLRRDGILAQDTEGAGIVISLR